ncbi:hypothetical protein J6590_108001, partial [Homalodisca vitripennis]
MPRIRKFGKRRNNSSSPNVSQEVNSSKPSTSNLSPTKDTSPRPKLSSSKKKLQYLSMCSDDNDYYDTPNAFKD